MNAVSSKQGAILLGIMLIVLGACSSATTGESGATDLPTQEATDVATEASANASDPSAAGPSDVSPVTVRFAATPAYFFSLPIHMATDLGLWERAGITLETTEMTDSGAAARALAGGSLDVAVMGPAVVLAAARDAGVTIVGSVNNVMAWSLIVQPDIASAADLAGRVMGTDGVGNTQELVLQSLPDDAGLPIADINLVPIGGSSSRLTALLEGQIDAAALASPAEFLAEDEGLVNLGPLADFRRYWSSQPIAVSNDTLNSDPEAVVRFLGVLQDAAEYIQDPANEADVIERASRLLDLDADSVQELYDYWLKGDLGPDVFPATLKIDPPEVITAIVDAYKAAGEISDDFDATSIFDNAYADEAIARP